MEVGSGSYGNDAKCCFEGVRCFCESMACMMHP